MLNKNAPNVKQRTLIVQSLMCQGIGLDEIFYIVNDPNRKGMNWGITYRSLMIYSKYVRRSWLKTASRSSAYYYAKHLAQREALYRLMLNAGDYRGALEVLKDVAQLQGLYVDRKLILSKNLDKIDFSKLSDADLRKMIEEGSYKGAEEVTYEDIIDESKQLPGPMKSLPRRVANARKVGRLAAGHLTEVRRIVKR